MEMTDYSKFPYHAVSEQFVNTLRKQNQNTESDNYFRVLASFYLAQVASTMRTTISTEDRGDIPVNLYALLTAPSGMGKTKSVNIIERNILSGFYRVFKDDTLPSLAQQAMDSEAQMNANKSGKDFDEELGKLEKEYDSLGAYVFSFSEGSSPAFRQIRTKCQIAGVGSTNFICDEFGYNVIKNSELLDIHFDVFDIGVVNNKIKMSSSDNKRYKQRSDAVPSNVLAFGTPDKMFDGAAVERELMSRFDSGYARRFLFGEGYVGVQQKKTAEELYDALVQGAQSTDLSALRDLFTRLADEVHSHKVIQVNRNEGIALTNYKLECEARAAKLPVHQSIRIAEMQHRYFRALKLAGSYAFVDSTANITSDQLYAAIRVVEDSGNAFQKIITRPKAHVRLAHYIASVDEEVTHADMLEELPFYPTARNKQEEMLSMSIAWGHKNHHIIKRTIVDGIEFFKGETLQALDLNHLNVAYSKHEAYHYENKSVSWESLQSVCQASGYHFTNHLLKDGHRCDDNVIIGCDYIVLDLDGGVSIKEFAALMKGVKCYIYTTKRHTEAANRFRVILPLKYHLKLTKADYKAFVNSIIEDLPFEVDECSNQRSKKWLSNSGAGGEIDGELFDPVPYLPNTKKNTDRIEENKSLGNLSKIQRFFAKQWHSGRNNTLLKYGMMLLDSGISLQQAIDEVNAFNSTFSDPLTSERLNTSVFKTMGRKASQ